MCGIIGAVNIDNQDFKVDKQQFTELILQLKHRGPDGYGEIHDEKFSFGHTRLNIIDLSLNAKQPMSDNNNRVFITYNGEIYNYRELRDELISKGHIFLNQSDTEVIIEAYKEWGIECIHRFIGMFAFGLYDNDKQVFYLVRDRIGVKPVYYSHFNGMLVFASELKGIINFSNFNKELNLNAISSFLSFRYSVGRDTYFKDIYQLEPGQYLKLQDGVTEINEYWDIKIDKKKPWYSKKSKQKLKQLISDAVTKRKVSDVTVGAYLSGGIDSTVILNEMSKNENKAVKTFTVTFLEDGYNESYYSSLAARAYNAENIEIKVNGTDYLNYVKEMIRFKDQPLGMHNEVALYLMAKQLKNYVTVVLSGEGADEIFGGYGRIFRSPLEYKRIKFFKRLPAFIRNRVFKRLQVDEKLCTETEFDYFLSQYTYFPVNEKFCLYNDEMKNQVNSDSTILKQLRNQFEKVGSNFHDRLSYFFIKVHLPGLLLMMDSTSMASGVEVRVPFVDHRIIEESFNIPERYKIKWKSFIHFLIALLKPRVEISENYDVTKFVLKDLYRHEVPKEIIKRKKMVFPVPLDDWFKGSLSQIVHSELLSEQSKIKAVFNQKKLKDWIEENERSSSSEYGRKIWRILNLEFWLREYY